MPGGAKLHSAQSHGTYDPSQTAVQFLGCSQLVLVELLYVLPARFSGEHAPVHSPESMVMYPRTYFKERLGRIMMIKNTGKIGLIMDLSILLTEESLMSQVGRLLGSNTGI